MNKQSRLTQVISVLAIVLSLLLAPVSSVKTMAAGFDSLSAKEKDSSYGFFVWLSENAAKAEDRKDAEAAAQILKNQVSDAYKKEVMNDGHIIGGSGNVTYNDLINATRLGEENDATSLDCLRDAVNFVTLGNQYREKENLAPLKISSALMAMSELDANIQNYPEFWGHPSQFKALENLAYRRLGGSWKYGKFDGVSDDPFEGWYTQEKKYYDAGNTNKAGHYMTMTDRQGKMLITGLGVRYRLVNGRLQASDDKYYDVVYNDKYYSQHYSTRDTMYNIGNGFTPEEYLAYLDQYQCYAVGHKLTETKGKDASCTEAGTMTYYTCSVCKKRFSDKEGETEINDLTIPAKGHQWNKDYTTDKEASCTEEGEESIHCSVCDAVKEGSARAIEKKAHEYGEWKTTKEAGCLTEGSQEKKCIHCEDTISESIPAKGHQWNKDYTTDKEASCKEEGEESIHCSVCDAMKEGSTRAIEKKDHEYGEWKTTKEAGCLTEGSQEKKCLHCDDTVSESIPAKGHQWNKTYTTDKEASCAEEGEESIHCSVCDAVKEGSARAIEKKAHEYGQWKTITDPTYDQAGLRRRTCNYCDSYEEEEIPVLDKPEPTDPVEEDPAEDKPVSGNIEAAKPAENLPQTVTTDIAPNKPVAKEAVEKLIQSQKSDTDPKEAALDF